MAGAVVAGEQRVDKPGTLIDPASAVRLKEGAQSPYVSRGGHKLAGGLEAFGLDVTGVIALDVGASTGGFTDCLLQHGAAKVFAVDVGYGQLAWSLRQDPRVVNLERRNIRSLTPDELIPTPSLAVIDASFISLTLVIPQRHQFDRRRGERLSPWSSLNLKWEKGGWGRAALSATRPSTRKYWRTCRRVQTVGRLQSEG